MNDDNWSGFEILGRGANRVCVRDPGDPASCLKFELASSPRGDSLRLRHRVRRWLGRNFSGGSENAQEWRAYRRLRARLGAELDAHFPVYHGLIDTARGRALKVACACDGVEPARSLYHHIFEARVLDAAALCAAVDRIEAFLIQHRIPLFDLNSGNFVVVRQPDGALRLVCIDLKSLVSGKEIVPISRWSDALMRRKIARRAERLRRRIVAALAGGTPDTV